MELWNSKTLSEALNVKAPANISISSVSIDSRTLQPGALFVAIRGENFGGNTFALSAIKNGAAAVIVDNLPKGLEQHQDKIIKVADTMDALNQLAVYRRANLKAKVIGVTGSVGKTSTKEMLRIALSTQGKTLASHDNFKNHYGMPLSIANIPSDIEFLVLEMGINTAVELKYLSLTGKPDVAVITTVELVHLEFFNSMTQIALTKAMIFAGVAPGGYAILNKDNPHFSILRAEALRRNLKIISFGTGNADIKLTSYQVNNDTSEVSTDSVDYVIGSTGRHLAMNSLSVIAVGKALGLDIDKMAKSLIDFKQIEGRGAIHDLPKLGIKLIDDSYNASPVSVKAAIENITNYRNSGRLVAILGDMVELGNDTVNLHLSLLEPLISNDINMVHTVGNLMKNLHDKLPADRKGIHTDNSILMAAAIAEHIQPNDVVLVKGSNIMKMNEVVKQLMGD